MDAGGSVSAVIVGGGHSGLAMSKRLSDRGVDHVVLERGEVGSSWSTQRWDSFTLLTPNWQTRLPDFRYGGADPDGFMTGPEVAELLRAYAGQVDAPLHAGTAVTSVSADGDGYEVVSAHGRWRCRSVVLAGGASNLPSVPAFASGVPEGVMSVNPLDYRSPDDLPDGGVLVVGAAATGVQLAEEIQASGRPVTLSVGEHVRMPRTYRGRDIQHWMEVTGRLDERYDEVEEIRKARAVASPQLVGTPEARTLDLNALTDAGVRLCGRLGAIRDGVALFSGGLRNTCLLADQKLSRLLDEIDQWIEANDAAVPDPPVRFEPTRVAPNSPLTLDLHRGEIAAVVWATGFRPDLSWVELPVFDEGGRLRHDGGVVADAPGVYFLGGTFLRRRRSSFIHGAEADTADLSEHLVGTLGSRR